jgi:hypothetical protein
VFYGGSSEVHVLDSDNLKWESPEVEGTAPVHRIEHSITTLVCPPPAHTQSETLKRKPQDHKL